jgi:hypothetical protein
MKNRIRISPSNLISEYISKMADIRISNRFTAHIGLLQALFTIVRYRNNPEASAH